VIVYCKIEETVIRGSGAGPSGELKVKDYQVECSEEVGKLLIANTPSLFSAKPFPGTVQRKRKTEVE